MESVARPGALPAGRGAPAPRRRRPGRGPVRRDVRRGRRERATPTRSSLSESELALLAMDRGRWAEAAEHLELALATIDRAPAARLRPERARLRRRGPARRAPRRPERGATASSRAAMRARPSCTFALPYLAVRVRLQLAKVYWAIGDQTTAGTCSGRSTTSCSHRPGARRPRRRGRRHFRATARHRSRRPARPARRRSLRPSCGCSPTCRPTSRSARSPSGCSCPATPSAPRSARSTGSWASRRAATPWNRRPRSVCSAGSRATATAAPGVVDVVPERHRQLRGRGDDARSPLRARSPPSTIPASRPLRRPDDLDRRAG